MNVYVIILAVVVVLALVLGNLWRDVQAVKAVIHHHESHHDHGVEHALAAAAEPEQPEVVDEPSTSKDK